MRKSDWTPSIVPNGDDATVYLVADGFGKHRCARREGPNLPCTSSVSKPSENYRPVRRASPRNRNKCQPAAARKQAVIVTPITTIAARCWI